MYALEKHGLGGEEYFAIVYEGRPADGPAYRKGSVYHHVNHILVFFFRFFPSNPPETQTRTPLPTLIVQPRNSCYPLMLGPDTMYWLRIRTITEGTNAYGMSAKSATIANVIGKASL